MPVRTPLISRSFRSKLGRCGAPAAVALALALALPSRAGTTAPQSAAPETPAPPTAAEILARVKAGLRANERPAYVVYTLVRRDTVDFAPDFSNSYTLRIWCRTADSAALSRHVDGSRVRGPAEFINPVFDKPIDPGPPTADLLDVIRQTQASATSSGPTAPPSATPANEPAGVPSALPQPGETPLPVIGSVSITIERHYRATYAGLDDGDYHIHLEPLRDPDHNRLTDLYVNRRTFALHRAVAHDHLYTGLRTIPERFEIDFGTQAGIPVITAIHGETDYTLADRSEVAHTVDYKFEEIAFPAALPDWYFEPAHYGEHRDEYPSDLRRAAGALSEGRVSGPKPAR